MSAPFILIVGMIVVVCGVLVLRLHALLSLIAGGLVVALLTPPNNTYRAAARLAAMEIESIDQTTHRVTLRSKSKPAAGMTLWLLQGRDLNRIGALHVLEGGGKETIVTEATDSAVIDRRDLAIEPIKDLAAHKAAEQTAGERLAEGFGKTAASVG